MPSREADEGCCRENVTGIWERLDGEQSVLPSYTPFIITFIPHSHTEALHRCVQLCIDVCSQGIGVDRPAVCTCNSCFALSDVLLTSEISFVAINTSHMHIVLSLPQFLKNADPSSGGKGSEFVDGQRNETNASNHRRRPRNESFLVPSNPSRRCSVGEALINSKCLQDEEEIVQIYLVRSFISLLNT